MRRREPKLNRATASVALAIAPILAALLLACFGCAPSVEPQVERTGLDYIGDELKAQLDAHADADYFGLPTPTPNTVASAFATAFAPKPTPTMDIDAYVKRRMERGRAPTLGPTPTPRPRPTPRPTPVREPLIWEYSGDKGKSGPFECSLPSGKVRFDFEHSGNGPYTVYVNGPPISPGEPPEMALLVSGVGKFEGYFDRDVRPEGSILPGPCAIEVTAAGKWSLKITIPR